MVVEFIWKQPNLLQVSDVYPSYWRQVFSFFRIVADNLDFSLSARIQTSKLRNQSIHWTHHLAIRDRVVTPCRDHAEATGQRKLMDLKLSELLPSKDSNFAVESDFITLVSRILVKYLPAFSFLKDVVVHHIPHQYSQEMAQKSWGGKYSYLCDLKFVRGEISCTCLVTHFSGLTFVKWQWILLLN